MNKLQRVIPKMGANSVARNTHERSLRPLGQADGHSRR